MENEKNEKNKGKPSKSIRLDEAKAKFIENEYSKRIQNTVPPLIRSNFGRYKNISTFPTDMDYIYEEDRILNNNIRISNRPFFCNINKKVEKVIIPPILTELEQLFFDRYNLDQIITNNNFSWLDKNLKLAFAYFINVIIPYYYAKKKIFNTNLSIDDLNKLGYRSFLDALERKKGINLKTFINWFNNLSKEKKKNVIESIQGKIKIAQKHIRGRLKDPNLNSLIQKNINNQNFNTISNMKMTSEKMEGNFIVSTKKWSEIRDDIFKFIYYNLKNRENLLILSINYLIEEIKVLLKNEFGDDINNLSNQYKLIIGCSIKALYFILTDAEITAAELKNKCNINDRTLYNLKNALDINLKDEDGHFVKSDIDNRSRPLIQINDFKEKLEVGILKIINILSSKKEEEIKIKAIDILNEFITDIKRKKKGIHFNTQTITIATSIIYAVLNSEEDFLDLGFRDLSKLTGVNKETIRENYNKYFRDTYPSSEFSFTVHGFGNINKIFSLIIFNYILEKTSIKTTEILLQIKKIFINNNFPEDLKNKDIIILRRMYTYYINDFNKYFSDLIKVVKYITFTSKNHKIINANIVILPVINNLYSKNINLLQKKETFYKYVREIFDFLAIKNEDFFPDRLSRAFEEKLSKQEYKEYYYRYRQIVGYRLKIFIIKNLYNGKYLINTNCYCPICKEEGLILNTDLSRLNSLEFHHQTKMKTEIFNANRLYNIFTENQTNPDFFQDIIKLMESEKVTLRCRNHHMMIDDFYYFFFEDFISFKDLFEFSAEEIYIILRIVVDNFRLTMNLSKDKKRVIRQRIKNRIKKKYIIEQLYGNKCHICGEFNTKMHIRSFDFCHQNPEKKTVNASSLFDTYSCSEIVKILRKENGAYLCSNCHTVYDMEYLNLINEIYDSKELIEKVKEDYHRTRMNFSTISDVMVDKVKDPLKKSINIRGQYKKYLLAIYNLSKKNIKITKKSISNHLGLDYSAVKSFFLRHRNFLENYINFSNGKPTFYSLKTKGKKLISKIEYFKNLYQSFQLEDCVNCNFNVRDKCIANSPNQCSILKKKVYI